MRHYSYLALGDSYTVGEQVMLTQSFPYQTVQLMRKSGANVYAPEIVATTGWSTQELIAAMDENILLAQYSFVSLLIGVNNQYQGRNADEFRIHFRLLLELAIQRAGGIAAQVLVLSIPDWSVTPYGADKDPEKIKEEIDMYNFICKAEADHFQTGYINITDDQRVNGHETEFLATDLLHPSGAEYARWATKASAYFLQFVPAT